MNGLLCGPDTWELTIYYGPATSQLGRFMTPDWSGSPVLVPYADLGNPQTFNLYSYVANNPLNTVDPEGHFRLNPPGSFVPYHDPDTGGLYGEVTPLGRAVGSEPVLKAMVGSKNSRLPQSLESDSGLGCSR